MGLQDRLLVMLSDWFDVGRTGSDGFVVKPAGGAPVRLLATEANLSEYASRNAADGLMALGDVGEDNSGVLAAIALLSVHIMEAIEAPSGEPATLLAVSNGALSMQHAETTSG